MYGYCKPEGQSREVEPVGDLGDQGVGFKGVPGPIVLVLGERMARRIGDGGGLLKFQGLPIYCWERF